MNKKAELDIFLTITGILGIIAICFFLLGIYFIFHITANSYCKAREYRYDSYFVHGEYNNGELICTIQTLDTEITNTYRATYSTWSGVHVYH